MIERWCQTFLRRGPRRAFIKEQVGHIGRLTCGEYEMSWCLKKVHIYLPRATHNRRLKKRVPSEVLFRTKKNLLGSTLPATSSRATLRPIAGVALRIVQSRIWPAGCAFDTTAISNYIILCTSLVDCICWAFYRA